MARDQGERIVDEDLGRHAAERGERTFQASSFWTPIDTAIPICRRSGAPSISGRPKSHESRQVGARTRTGPPDWA
jgi:hypothetical protein